MDGTNTYYVKRALGDTWTNLLSLFDGLRILRIDGFMNKGEPINVFTQQWISSQKEDYLVTAKDENNVPIVIRKNKDIDITFVVSDKYATGEIDVRAMHDAFIAYMTDGAIYLKSNYAERALRCVCLKDYKPTLVKLQRGSAKNYMTGTLTLHALDERAGDDDGYIGNPYPTPSDEGGDTQTPAQPIYTTQVVDVALNKTQAALNQEFHNKPSASFSYANEVLTITTQ